MAELSDDYIPSELLEIANEALLKTLPAKSSDIYVKTYEHFLEWMTKKKTNSISETVLLAHFNEISKTLSPPCFWTRYSILASMIYIQKDIDIRNYRKLKSFIKQTSVGYTPKKAKVFATKVVKDFIENAPESTFLPAEVALILGTVGACRRNDLYSLTMENIKLHGSLYTFHLPDTKTNKSRTFTVEGEYANIITKYINKRPSKLMNNDNLFLAYRNDKCTCQKMGIHTIGEMPKKIAEFLNLPDWKLYTGHSFRRTSASILFDAGADMTELKRHGGWHSSTITEGYVDESIENKRRTSKRITSAINETNNDESN